jgi:hypothetical protein
MEAFSNPWLYVFLVLAVGAILYARSANTEGASTVGFVGAMGGAVMGIGLLLLVMPWASQATADFDFVSGDNYNVLSGAAYILGLIAVAAGIVLMRYKDSS